MGTLLLVAAACGPPPPPPQPIAFSHASHAAKDIPCERCHRGARQAAQAGLPALASCAACHRRQIPDHPEVQKVLAHFKNEEPILWHKVNVLPASAMVHFKHKPHARAGIACDVCHGNVAEMTVARAVVNTANMGWCLDCHREREASTDCLTCHH